MINMDCLIDDWCFLGDSARLLTAWNPKQPLINGCFNWMIPNLYIGNGWKSPFPSTLNWLFGVPGVSV